MVPPGSSTLTVGTSPTTAAGSYTLTITGRDSTGAPAHSTSVTMVVNLKGGFTLSATPFVPNPVSRGGETGDTVTETASGHFNGTVTFSASPAHGAVRPGPFGYADKLYAARLSA